MWPMCCSTWVVSEMIFRSRCLGAIRYDTNLPRLGKGQWLRYSRFRTRHSVPLDAPGSRIKIQLEGAEDGRNLQYTGSERDCLLQFCGRASCSSRIHPTAALNPVAMQ